MCTGFHEGCDCPECSYANMLYSELEFLESFCPEDKKEIQRITDELESLGYSV